MTALNHPHAAPSPAWTGDKVRARMVEAFEIDRRMPGDRRKMWQTARGSWPATPIDTFRDQMHWNNPGDNARDRKWQEWASARNVSPPEITRMDEAFSWLRWLPDHQRKALETYAKAEVIGMPLIGVLRYRRIKKTQFYEHLKQGTQRIADRLNSK